MVKRIRKRYWIDSKIQGALALRILFHWVTFAVIAVVLTLILQYFSNPWTMLSDQLALLWNRQSAFAIVILVLLPIFIYDTVKLSNRFAGPVLRLRRVMKQIADGQPPERLKFRDNDFWIGMAEDFNKLIDMGYFDEPREEAGTPTSLDGAQSEDAELIEA